MSGEEHDEPTDPTLADSGTELTARVRSRLSGQVRSFRVVVLDNGLILQGHAHTYYAKQLAQHAVMEATQMPIIANEILVS